MRGGKPEVINSGGSKPKVQSPVKQEQVKEKVDDQSQKVEDQSKEELEDAEPLDLKTVEEQVGWMLNEQLAQRDQIDKLQGLVQDLVRILNESNVNVPATTKPAAEKSKPPSSSSKKNEAIPAVEEKEVPDPQNSNREKAEEDLEREKEIILELKSPKDDEEIPDEADEADVPKPREQEVEQTVEAEASDKEEREAEEEDPAESRAERKRKKKEKRAALKLKMKEKLRAMRRKARRRAEKKRADAAAAKEKTTEPSTAPLPQHLQGNQAGSTTKSRKMKDNDTLPPPEDNSLRSKRKR